MIIQLKQVAVVLPLHKPTNYSKSTDVQLIVACQNREPLAFASLHKRYMNLVVSYVKRIAPEKTDMDDLIQDIFVKVWRSISSLRDPSAFRGWLKRIVSNCFYDEIRRRQDKNLVYLDAPFAADGESDGSFIQVPDAAAQPDVIAEDNEMQEKIDAGMLKLKPYSRKVLLLRQSGLTYDEIADETQTEKGTVRSRLSRARTKLRALVFPELPTAA